MSNTESNADDRSSLGEVEGNRSLESVSPRRRTTDQVYETLRDAILSHRLQPGAKLSVPSLADQLNVSRSPVREAVQKLVQQGLATEEVHRGAVVTRLNPTSILQLYELREGLEALAARLACERATTEELKEIAVTVTQHSDALAHKDYRRHLELDQRFHAQIRRATKNEHLESALEKVQDMVTIAMLSADTTWPRHALAEHEAILTALQLRSSDEAAAAATRHIARLRRDLTVLFDEPRNRSVVAEHIEAQES